MSEYLGLISLRAALGLGFRVKGKGGLGLGLYT